MVLNANSKVSGYMNIRKKILHCLAFTAKPFRANPISGVFAKLVNMPERESNH